MAAGVFRAPRRTPRLKRHGGSREPNERYLQPPNLDATWYGTLGEWAVRRVLDKDAQAYTFIPNQAPREELGGVRGSFVLHDRVVNVSDTAYSVFEQAQIESRGLIVIQLTERMAQMLIERG